MSDGGLPLGCQRGVDLKSVDGLDRQEFQRDSIARREIGGKSRRLLDEIVLDTGSDLRVPGPYGNGHDSASDEQTRQP